MNKRLLLFFLACRLVPLAAQDTLKEVFLPDVHFIESTECTPTLLSHPDSLMWSVAQSADLGRMLGQSGLINQMAYGPAGTASLIRMNGTAPDHTNLLWNGISLQSMSLGMADFSLVPVFFFDGVSLNARSAPQLAQGGLGGDVSLLSRDVPQSGHALRMIAEMNSLQNQFYGAHWRNRNKHLEVDTRIMMQQFRNHFSYIDSYQPGTPRVWQTRNDGEMYGLSHRGSYRAGNHRIRWEAFGVDRAMQLPGIMGFESRKWSVQRDRQLRTLMAHEWSAPQSRFFVQSGAALIVDQQHYSQHTEEGQAELSNSTDGTQAHIFSRIRWRNSTGFSAELLGQLTHGEVNYDERRDVSAVTHALSGIVEQRWRKWTVLSSTRLDARSMRKAALSSTMMVSRRFRKSSADNWRIELSQRARVPDFNELYWIPGGNPVLNNERSRGGKMAVELAPQEGKWELAAEAFYFRIRDWIQWIPGNAGIWSPVNFKEVTSHGAELSVRRRWEGRVRTSVLMRGQWNRVSGRNEGAADSFIMVYSPEYRTLIQADAAWKSWRLFVTGRYQSRRFTDEANDLRKSLDPFVVADAGIRTELGGKKVKTECTLRVENAFNHQYELVRAYAIPGRVWSLTCAVFIN
jgi:vitamin B12 transporter